MPRYLVAHVTAQKGSTDGDIAPTFEIITARNETVALRTVVTRITGCKPPRYSPTRDFLHVCADDFMEQKLLEIADEHYLMIGVTRLDDIWPAFGRPGHRPFLATYLPLDPHGNFDNARLTIEQVFAATERAAVQRICKRLCYGVEKTNNYDPSIVPMYALYISSYFNFQPLDDVVSSLMNTRRPHGRTR